MYLQRFMNYLEYFLFSHHKRGHGLHSPFVFKLVSEHFRNKIDPGVVKRIEFIRNSNISDKRLISVRDLGAGSLKMKGNIRKVSEIARYSPVPRKYGMLLSNLASGFGGSSIIEMGTSLGISTMYLASGAPESMVYTIEGCPATASVARENFLSSGIENIRLLTGSFEDHLPELIGAGIKPGLVFIDGNHRNDPVLSYFRQVVDISGPDTLVILDDIHISEEMDRAWEEIKRNENVTITIDIFRMGLVFFRKGIARFNYVIRY